MALIVMLVVGGLLRESNANTYQRARITAMLRKGKPRPKDWLPTKKPKAAPAAPVNTRPSKTKANETAKKSRPAPKNSRVDYSKQMASALNSLNDDGPASDREIEGVEDGVEDGEALIAELGDEYMTKIYKAVKAQYSVPEIISERERMFLQATVVITINAQGKIKDLSFEKKSSNTIFDSAIEGAIRRAAPFPAPPKELVDKYASEGIGIEFAARRM
jgi:TonB family protein